MQGSSRKSQVTEPRHCSMITTRRLRHASLYKELKKCGVQNMDQKLGKNKARIAALLLGLSSSCDMPGNQLGTCRQGTWPSPKEKTTVRSQFRLWEFFDAACKVLRKQELLDAVQAPLAGVAALLVSPEWSVRQHFRAVDHHGSRAQLASHRHHVRGSSNRQRC